MTRSKRRLSTKRRASAASGAMSSDGVATSGRLRHAASIERATGRTAEIAGKPNQPMADLLTARFGSDSVFVGDSLGTDGEMARRLGWQFGLVLSGHSRTDQVPTDQPAEWVAEDLSALVDRMLGGDGSR